MMWPVGHDRQDATAHPKEPGMNDPDLTDWRGQRTTRIEHLERILEALEQTVANRAALDLITELAKER
jgi:uncharacterized membrane protein YccC